MSADSVITVARAWEIRRIARRLRMADMLEIEQHGHDSAAEVLEHHRARWPAETFVFRFRRGDPPVALFGCHEVSPGLGCPWLVGTDDIAGAPKEFHAAAVRQVRTWRQRFQRLSNLVWVHSSSIPWLERLGFAVEPEIAWVSPVGGEFLRFGMQEVA